jgi:hypothetical protein
MSDEMLIVVSVLANLYTAQFSNGVIGGLIVLILQSTKTKPI